MMIATPWVCFPGNACNAISVLFLALYYYNKNCNQKPEIVKLLWLSLVSNPLQWENVSIKIKHSSISNNGAWHLQRHGYNSQSMHAVQFQFDSHAKLSCDFRRPQYVILDTLFCFWPFLSTIKTVNRNQKLSRKNFWHHRCKICHDRKNYQLKWAWCLQCHGFDSLAMYAMQFQSASHAKLSRYCVYSGGHSIYHLTYFLLFLALQQKL